MKQFTIGSLLMLLIFSACNNQGTDSVKEADSTNEANLDLNNRDTATAGATDNLQSVKTDEPGADFLVRAANAGLTEIENGNLGEQRATHADVKRFATMMVKDHTAANEEVMKLATARQVTLPATPSNDDTRKADRLADKKTDNFDKDFMDRMVKDHKDAIDLFEKYSDKTTDAGIKSFIQSTLPKLKMHLDSAQAIRKMVK